MKLGIIGSGAVGFAVGYTAARLGIVLQKILSLFYLYK